MKNNNNNNILFLFFSSHFFLLLLLLIIYCCLLLLLLFFVHYYFILSVVVVHACEGRAFVSHLPPPCMRPWIPFAVRGPACLQVPRGALVPAHDGAQSSVAY